MKSLPFHTSYKIRNRARWKLESACLIQLQWNGIKENLKSISSSVLWCPFARYMFNRKSEPQKIWSQKILVAKGSVRFPNCREMPGTWLVQHEAWSKIGFQSRTLKLDKAESEVKNAGIRAGTPWRKTTPPNNPVPVGLTTKADRWTR